MKSSAIFAAAAAILAGSADAFWRMKCQSRSGLARLDPLVDPDVVSSHGHVIHGGRNFGMSATSDDLMNSDCTSCRVRQDKSAYWTPPMHFIHENGTTVMVPQVGGMLAYYLLFGEDIKAFPTGFQMLAGDTRLRNFSGPVPDKERSLWDKDDMTQFALGQKALGFNCLNYRKDPPEPSMFRHFLPDKDYMDANCPQGIRAEIFFPSCWNGQELDTKNHRDHMAYPDLVNTGTCPPGFPVRVPSLFYETIWDTAKFKGMPGQFVFANGDPTGCGYHGDFITGWKPEFLQAAVNQCTDPTGNIEACPLFDIQSMEEASQCNFDVPEVLKQDNCAGPADGLCGNVPIQPGPDYAAPLKPGNGEQPTQPTPPAITDAAPVPTLSYQAPQSAVTDKYGGGISVMANVDVDAHQSQAEKIDVAATPEPAPVATSAPPPAAPAPTEPPVLQEPAHGKIVSTSTYTSAGVVYEVAIEEVAVYVTVDAPPARRHLHHHQMHHRRDREHGLLGRY